MRKNKLLLSAVTLAMIIGLIFAGCSADGGLGDPPNGGGGQHNTGGQCEHDFSILQDTIDPTCIAVGKEIYLCSIGACGETEYRDVGNIDPNNHKMRPLVNQAGTVCGEPGFEGYECELCDSIDGDEIPGSYKDCNYSDPTCTTRGICFDCGNEAMRGPYSRLLPHIPGVAATCATPQVCAECRVELSPVVLCDWGTGWEPHKDYPVVNCVERGKEIRTCAFDHYETRPLPGNNLHNWGNWIIVTPAACGIAGLEERICARNCLPGNAKMQETRPITALSHNPTNVWQVRNGGELFKGCTHGCGKADKVLSNEAITQSDINPIAQQIGNTLIIPAGVTSIGREALSVALIQRLNSVTFLAGDIDIAAGAFGIITSIIPDPKGSALRTRYLQEGKGVYTYEGNAWTFKSLNN